MEDLGCLVHMPGPVRESWKLYLELATDYGRMTSKPEGTELLLVCRPLVQNRRTRCAAVNGEICVPACTRFPLPGAIQRK